MLYLRAVSPPDKYAVEKEYIEEIFTQNKKRYGHRRITAVLRNKHGIIINHKTVMRLMSELHLYCPARRKHKHYCKYGDSAGTFEPNLLQREDFFYVLFFNGVFIRTLLGFKKIVISFGKKLYLSVILDMYNGEIINYTLTESASLASVQQLISQAITLLPQGTNLLFHSDRGWQYSQNLWQKWDKKYCLSRIRKMPQSGIFDPFAILTRNKRSHLVRQLIFCL